LEEAVVRYANRGVVRYARHKQACERKLELRLRRF
jgi:hypothetical protein